MLKSISCFLIIILTMAILANASEVVQPSIDDEDALAFNFVEFFTGSKGGIDTEQINDQNLAFVEVSNTSSSSATITWLSKATCVGRIEYGITEDLGLSKVEDKPTQIHSVLLSGLPSDQTIYYRVSSGEVTGKILSFNTASISPGIPKSVYGTIPPGVQDHESKMILKLFLSGSGGNSQPLSVRINPDDIWLLNLGNLKTETGQVFQFSDQMTAEITVEGIGLTGKPEVIHSYKVRLSDRPSGDLSERPGLAEDRILMDAELVSMSSRSPEKVVIEKSAVLNESEITPERRFLESLLNKGSKSRADGRRGHGKPHIIPGWRGGSKMANPSRPPKPEPPPNRIHLRGDVVLKEIIQMRQERSEARDFFPDVGRHFPDLSEKLSRDTYPVTLYQGINIVALPVDPYTSVTSYSFLSDVEGATEVTAWDGVLQQFGASAIKVGENIIGDDFTFELGYGYFTTMDSTDTVNFEGDPQTKYAYIPTYAGLNLVSLIGNQDSLTSFTIFNELFSGEVICQFNTEIQSFQCAFEIGDSPHGDEFQIDEGTGYFVTKQTPGFFPEDNSLPSLSIITPPDQDSVYSKQPFIDIIFGDLETGLDTSTFSCQINGVNKTSFFTIDDLGANWQMDGAEELLEGINSIEASIYDLAGNERYVISAFTVITTPPTADEHFVNGYIYNGETWEPLEGVAITVDSIPGVIYTDSAGHYVFPTPGLGEYRIDIQKEHFTYSQRYIYIEDGHGDVFIDDAYLTPKDSIITRITTDGGVAVNSHGSIFTSFPANTVEEDIDAITTQYDEDEDLPAPLPELSVFTYCADFGPDGELLDTAYIDYLNHRGFATSTPIPLGGYNSGTMEWEHEGFATVGSDDSWFEFGLKHFSPHDPNFPVAPRPTPKPVSEERAPRNPKHACNAERLRGSPSLGFVKSKFGGCLIGHEIPTISSYGIDRSLSFSYASHTIKPTIVLETEIEGNSIDSLPLYLGIRLDLTGRRFEGVINPSTDSSRQRVRFNAKDISGLSIPTNAYHFGDAMANFVSSEYYEADYFGGPPTNPTGITTDFPVGFDIYLSGNIMVDSRMHSEYGNGWALDGLQRLYFRPDGDALITVGGAASQFYERSYARSIIDLVVAGEESESLNVFIGDGSGEFPTRQDYHVIDGSYPNGVSTADFDGDGSIDLVVANSQIDSITVLMNDGSGAFIEKIHYPAGDYPRRMVTADLNGDTYYDIAVASIMDSTVTVYLNDGNGNFPSYQAYPVGDDPAGIEILDFDGDMQIDLVTSNHHDDDISILLNDGTANFSNRQDYSLGGSGGAASVSVGDFNNDDRPDVAVSRWGTNSVTVLINDGGSGFLDPTSFTLDLSPGGLVAGDYNGDGFIDLAITVNDFWMPWINDIEIYAGNGEGGFSKYGANYPVASAPTSIVSNYIDGDGLLDLAVACPEANTLTVLLNQGDAVFNLSQNYPAGSGAWGLAAADLNGDSHEPGFASEPGDVTTLIENPDSSGYTRVYPDSSKAMFDTAGFHIATIDRHGNTTAFEYDEYDRVTSITYPGDLITNIDYDVDGLIETVTDPAGRETHFDHDLDGNLISITNPDSSVTSYEYDSEHLLTKTIDPRGYETIYEYDENAYVTKVTAADNITKAILANNNFLVSDSYNTLNEAIAQGQGTSDNPADEVSSGDLTNVFVNTKGDSTFTLTNSYGRVLREIDVINRVHKKEYDEDGNLTATIRPDSTEVTYTYDKWGNPLTITDNEIDATIDITYDPVYHLPTEIEDANNNITTIIRNSQGDPIEIVNAMDDTTYNTYDSTGMPTKTLNPLGDSVLFVYNDTGRLVTITDPNGHSTYYEYDPAGNMIGLTDANGYRTEYEYDNMNRLKITRNALGYETEYKYDENGNMTELINAKGDTTHFDYDLFNRRISTTDPLGLKEENIYNTEHLLIHIVTPNGDTIHNVYDDVRRLTQNILMSDTTNYEYDLVSNIIEISDNDSRIQFDYDDSRRLIKAKYGDTLNPEIIQPFMVIDYEYDLNSNITKRIIPENDTLFYSYDILNRIENMVDKGDTIFYSYDQAGRVDSIVRSNNSITKFNYDAAGQLLDLNHVLDSDSIAVFHYQYDNAGNRVSLTDLDGLHTYNYDSLYQLTGATHPQPYNPTEYYTYGELGNRLTSHISASHVTDANNRLLEDDSCDYGYDNSGRQIWKREKATNDTTYYEYTIDDHLIRAYNDSVEIQFYYDGPGNRIQKTIITNNGIDTSISKYSYDGQNLLFKHNETDSIIVKYKYGPGIDNLLETRTQTEIYHHFSDALGTVTKITDNSGIDVKNYVYDTYGNIKIDSGSAPAEDISFTGREYERKLGLFYYRARYYNPEIGRFMTNDPIGMSGGNLNFYSYVNNNSVNWIDPLGMCLQQKGREPVEVSFDWWDHFGREFLKGAHETSIGITNAFSFGLLEKSGLAKSIYAYDAPITHSVSYHEGVAAGEFSRDLLLNAAFISATTTGLNNWHKANQMKRLPNSMAGMIRFGNNLAQEAKSIKQLNDFLNFSTVWQLYDYHIND